MAEIGVANGDEQLKGVASYALKTGKPTDKQILDWMAKEGLESCVRVPQCDRDGYSLHISFWATMWRPKEVYVSLRGAAIAGMIESGWEGD